MDKVRAKLAANALRTMEALNSDYIYLSGFQTDSSDLVRISISVPADCIPVIMREIQDRIKDLEQTIELL